MYFSDEDAGGTAGSTNGISTRRHYALREIGPVEIEIEAEIESEWTAREIVNSRPAAEFREYSYCRRNLRAEGPQVIAQRTGANLGHQANLDTSEVPSLDLIFLD